MNSKAALVAFQGEVMCFVHVLLNALDMKKKNYDVKIIMEGQATALVKTLDEPGHAFGTLYSQVKQAGLIDCVCKACANKMGSLESAENQGLTIRGDMSGHPALETYIKDGYQIITF